jgi:hypothetical protein
MTSWGFEELKQLSRNIKQAKWTPQNIGLLMTTIKIVGIRRHTSLKRTSLLFLVKRVKRLSKQLLMLICFGETDYPITNLRLIGH